MPSTGPTSVKGISVPTGEFIKLNQAYNNNTTTRHPRVWGKTASGVPAALLAAQMHLKHYYRFWWLALRVDCWWFGFVGASFGDLGVRRQPWVVSIFHDWLYVGSGMISTGFAFFFLSKTFFDIRFLCRLIPWSRPYRFPCFSSWQLLCWGFGVFGSFSPLEIVTWDCFLGSPLGHQWSVFLQCHLLILLINCCFGFSFLQPAHGPSSDMWKVLGLGLAAAMGVSVLKVNFCRFARACRASTTSLFPFLGSLSGRHTFLWAFFLGFLGLFNSVKQWWIVDVVCFCWTASFPPHLME